MSEKNNYDIYSFMAKLLAKRIDRKTFKEMDKISKGKKNENKTSRTL